MNRSLIKLIILLSLFGVVQSSYAKDLFGKSNRWGGFGSNYGDCNDWPEWTPMYWMEEMSGNNDNCYPGAYAGRGFGGTAYPYQSPYPYSPYANPYFANPYIAGVNPYALNPYVAQARIYPQNRTRGLYGSRQQRSSPFGTGGLTGFPRFGGNNFTNPFSSFNGTSSPFSSFGGGSPWSSYTSPMGFGGMPGMNPITPFSPMGGFGSPMSMGMPGMSPLGGFGGSPFGGGSSFMPFR